MSENPAGLLGDLRQLRRKVRQDRRGYAFPLLLFGALILVSSLFYVGKPWPEYIPPEGLVSEPIDPGPFPAFGSTRMYSFEPNTLVIEWYWMLGLVLCFVATTWWYRRRAELIGVETDTRSYLITAGAALVGMVFGVPVLEAIAAPRNTLYSTPEVNLPILFVATAISALVFLMGARWKRLRPVSAFVGTFSAMVAFSAIGVYMINGLSALLIIAGALLMLAWVERSPLLAGIGVLFTVAAVHANLQGMSSYFSNSITTDSRLLALQDLMLPGGVLVAGGVAALVISRWAKV